MYSKSVAVALASSLLFADAVPLSRLRTRVAADFGTCTDPTIKFAVGLDGRTGASFAPNNAADFNHGSALNIGVIASFICGQLQSSCKASSTAVLNCDAGETAASTLTGQAAADAFNTAVNGGAASPATPAVSASDSTTPSAVAGSTAPAESTAATSAGANVQTFTGALGGAPPPVTAGGKGFIVDGSEFINEAGALGRSCDVQHNACADAANAGGAAFSASDCDTQDTACKASIPA